MSFVGFAAFEAPSPDKQVVTRKGFAGADRELERACKQCGKKDASTKLKGLEALVARVSDVDANEVRAVAHWLRDARVVELLGFKDDDARVRQGLFDALSACASAGAPLRSVEAALAGPWWAATADACVCGVPVPRDGVEVDTSARWRTGATVATWREYAVARRDKASSRRHGGHHACTNTRKHAKNAQVRRRRARGRESVEGRLPEGKWHRRRRAES